MSKGKLIAMVKTQKESKFMQDVKDLDEKLSPRDIKKNPHLIKRKKRSEIKYDEALEAVKRDGNFYQNISHALRANRQIIEAAIVQGKGNPKYFSPSVRDNEDLMLAAVQNNPLYLEHGSINIRSHFEIVAAAVMEDRDALEFASDEIKSSPKYMVLLDLAGTKKRRR